MRGYQGGCNTNGILHTWVFITLLLGFAHGLDNKWSEQVKESKISRVQPLPKIH